VTNQEGERKVPRPKKSSLHCRTFLPLEEEGEEEGEGNVEEEEGEEDGEEGREENK
jgi:hypothetical protein